MLRRFQDRLLAVFGLQRLERGRGREAPLLPGTAPAATPRGDGVSRPSVTGTSSTTAPGLPLSSVQAADVDAVSEIVPPIPIPVEAELPLNSVQSSGPGPTSTSGLAAGLPVSPGASPAGSGSVVPPSTPATSLSKGTTAETADASSSTTAIHQAVSTPSSPSFTLSGNSIRDAALKFYALPIAIAMPASRTVAPFAATLSDAPPKPSEYSLQQTSQPVQSAQGSPVIASTITTATGNNTAVATAAAIAANLPLEIVHDPPATAAAGIAHQPTTGVISDANPRSPQPQAAPSAAPLNESGVSHSTSI